MVRSLRTNKAPTAGTSARYTTIRLVQVRVTLQYDWYKCALHFNTTGTSAHYATIRLVQVRITPQYDWHSEFCTSIAAPESAVACRLRSNAKATLGLF